MNDMRLFGLLGRNISHSFSPEYFNTKFKKENINAKYLLFDVNQLTDILKIIESEPHLEGFNVTIPYKQDIIQLLDEIDEAAREIGAVNVVKIFRAKGMTMLKGFNTDFIGFKTSIFPFVKNEYGIKSLVLGTGGVSKAVCFVLKELNIPYTKVSRTKSDDNITYDDITPELIKKNRLIINTTPLGMSPQTDTFPVIPYEALTSNHILFDMVYNPTETVFLKKGKQKNSIIINGLDMLYIQAEAGWDILTL